MGLRTFPGKFLERMWSLVVIRAEMLTHLAFTHTRTDTHTDTHRHTYTNEIILDYYYYYIIIIIVIIKTTHTLPHMHSHTFSRQRILLREINKQFDWHNWLTHHEPQTGMNDLPSSQQPPTSDGTPAGDTGVSRIHLSSVGLEQTSATYAPSFIDET